jgi:hypothetical protein
MLHLLGAFGVNEGFRRPDYTTTMEIAACEIALHRGQNNRYYYKGYTMSSVTIHSTYIANTSNIKIYTSSFIKAPYNTHPTRDPTL